MKMSLLPRGSVHIITAITGGILLSSIAVQAPAQVVFTGPSSFVSTPSVGQYGFPAFPGFNPPGQPGSGAFISSYILSDLDSGFKLSHASFTYTSVTEDIGKKLSIGWRIMRADEIGQFTTLLNVTSALDGTVRADSGITVNAIDEKTQYAALAPAIPPQLPADASINLASFVYDGVANNPIGASVTQQETVQWGTNLLEQSFYVAFTPTAAGQSITLTLPDSSESFRANAATTPEPTAASAIGVLTGCLCGLYLRKRYGRRKSRCGK